MSKWKMGTIASAVALFIALAAGLLVGASDNAPTGDNTPVAEAPGADLTVNFGDILPVEALCASDEFITNSLPSEELLWSDSVSTPFAANDTEAKFSELREELCGNPTLLLMTVEALSAVTIEDSVTIGDVNPWMAEFIAKANEDMFSLLTKKAETEDVVFVTADFQDVAELTNTVLLRLDNVESVVTEQSVTNWHVSAREGLAAGTIPFATLNEDQYEGEFLRLEYTLKGNECPAFAVGYNVGDKRFATLGVDCGDKPESPAPPTTPPTTPPTEEPQCPPDKPNGDWPVCKDKPENIPDTPAGGGGPAPDQPDPVGPPAGGEPPVTYAPAPTPEPSDPPVGSTLDPDPAPSAEPSVAPEKDPEVVCLAPAWDPTYCD